MTWKTLRDALEMAAACGFDVDGEGSVAAEPRRPKRAASTKPAAKSFREDTLPAKEVDANRWEYTATKAGAPHSEAVYCHLVVIEGGRRAGGGGRSPAYRSSPKDRANEFGWVVHSAASRTCVCEAAS